MNEIKLNLINRSNDQNNSEIVIFQKNVATDFNEMVIAWQVINNLGPGWHHTINYPASIAVAAADQEGNESPQIPAHDGQQWRVVQTAHGHDIVMGDRATMPTEVEILNTLPQGAIDARVYKGGKLFAVQNHVAPQQKAVFQFKPTIFIGVVSEVEEGQEMDSAIVSDVNTEISLFGIRSADIVMTGGGSGADATAFAFHLENVQMA